MSVDNEGLVVELDADMATVEVIKTGGCGHCDEPGGCGNTMLAQMRPNHPRRYRVPNDIGARLGDKVIVSVPEGTVLHAVTHVYAVPLACLVAGVGVGTLFGGELPALAGGAAGLLLAYLLLKRRAAAQNQPRLSMRVWEERGSCANRGA